MKHHDLQHEESDEGQHLQDVRIKAMTLRQNCRLQVSCRSGSMIVSRNAAGEVESFYAECNALKVKNTLPKQLVEALNSL